MCNSNSNHLIRTVTSTDKLQVLNSHMIINNQSKHPNNNTQTKIKTTINNNSRSSNNTNYIKCNLSNITNNKWIRMISSSSSNLMINSNIKWMSKKVNRKERAKMKSKWMRSNYFIINNNSSINSKCNNSNRCSSINSLMVKSKW